MQPYWQNETLTLYCGRAEEVLPTLDLSGVDAFLTDPPYGINGGRSHKDNYLMSDWEDTLEAVQCTFGPIVSYMMNTIARGAVTPGKFALMFYPQFQDFGVFWSPSDQGRGPWGFNAASPILYYGTSPTNKLGSRPSSYFIQPDKGNIGWHPCPKPIAAWMWLMSMVSLEGETIIDPFVGSGTTLVAAQRLQRKAIGIEIEEKYCEGIVKRLMNETPPLPMPIETQGDLIAG